MCCVQAARLAAQVAGDMEVPTKVRVENLHPDIAEQDLTDLFTPFGKVVSVRIEKINNRSSGLGHVEFKSLPDAQKAVAHLHGFELAGKTLRVVMTAQVHRFR
jgi:RNA recognition motif-containing protein